MNTPIGFVGVGAMGTPMASRLCERGFDVHVYDVEEERARQAAAATGAHVATSLEALAETETVICMLPNSTVVERVLGDEEGLFSILRPGSMVVDMGSSKPTSTQALAALATSCGLDFADAPVSGGVARARTGELTIMFGGPEELLDKCRDVFEAVGSTIIRVGDVGAGHAMKALNNLLSAIGLTAASEVIEAGRRFGLDPATMLQVLNRSTGHNNATETKFAQFVLSGTYGSGFSLRFMLKDIATAVELAHEQNLPIALGDACLTQWQEAAETLPPDADQTMIAQVVAAFGTPVRSTETS